MNYCFSCGHATTCEVCDVCPICHPKTQKLQGLVAAGSIFPYATLPVPVVLHVGCLVEESQLAPYADHLPAFARPCPTRPRHGFVESRVIETLPQLLALVEETRRADPDGEIMLTSVLFPEWNAVWMPGLITIGAGHDGATSGKSSTMRIPQVPVWVKDQFDRCGLAPDEVPYIEVIGNSTRVTQIRSGPAITSTSPDFIPKALVVKEIIPVDEDLLRWDTIMAQAEGREGVVVYHPKASVTDHASVHARSRGVALVTFPVEIGQELSPTPPSPPPDPGAVLAGVAWGDSLRLTDLDRNHLVRIMLMGLHHSSAMSGADGKWIGLSAAILLRLGSVALQGEARHETNPKTGVTYAHTKSRETVYVSRLNQTLSWHRARIGRLVNTFRYGIFAATGSCSTGGTGGMRWAACANSLIPLFNAVRDLAQTPTEGSVQALLRAINRAVHQAHNNGWWLNKFCRNTDAFMLIQQGDPRGIIHALTTLWALHQPQVFPAVEKSPTRYATWKETKSRPMRLYQVELSLIPGGLGVMGKARGVRHPFKIAAPIQGPIRAGIAGLINVLHDERLRVTMINAKAKGKPKEPDLTQLAEVLWEEPPMQDVDKNICETFHTSKEQL